MKILAISKLRSGVTPKDVQPHFHTEVQRSWELYKSGQLREFYSRADEQIGIVFVFECETVAEAKELVSALPMAEANLIEFDLIPLGPMKTLEALFAKQKHSTTE